MPVSGVNQVKSNMKRVFKDISDKKAPQFVNAVISIGAVNSKELTPVEYSNLVNSQRMSVDVFGDKVTGYVSFGAGGIDYAAFLEFNTTWKPRPISMKEGPATNMNAEPGFLRKGFESSESQSQIKQAEKIFKV